MEEPPSSASRYPVALLPNQYSDYFRRYSADELRSLPVMTVLKLPHKVTAVVWYACLKYTSCALEAISTTVLCLNPYKWSWSSTKPKLKLHSLQKSSTCNEAAPQTLIQKMFTIKAWFCKMCTSVACRQWRNHSLEQELEWCQKCDGDGWVLRPAQSSEVVSAQEWSSPVLR